MTSKSREPLRSVKPTGLGWPAVARLALLSLVALVAAAHLIDWLA